MYDLIEAARANGTAVFVHCSRGVSRSASVCIAYLMRKEGWSAQVPTLIPTLTDPLLCP